MSPLDQAGFMTAINVAISKVLLMPDATPDAMAAALGQSVGALAVIARDDVDAGTSSRRSGAPNR